MRPKLDQTNASCLAQRMNCLHQFDLCQTARSEAGFTLIELLVVVGILGVLAAVAVPNYAKYQAKARQTEAKIQLGALFAAEASNILENSTYSICLGNIGVGPDTVGTPGSHFYAFGFSDAMASLTTCGPKGSSSCQTFYSGKQTNIACIALKQPGGANNNSYSSAVGSFMLPTQTGSTYHVDPNVTMNPANIAAGTSLGADTTHCNLSSTQFVALAIGGIAASSTNPYDYWTIDESKTLTNVISGL